ncbi:hypothetical protein AQ490_25280 [Wenjunlia vitaminophila]|uniref:Glucan 1,4-alpha-glucosidase n=2 Tax=Wenjunlia vitaminophila TaxID=76728 RepID=A0A0T6LQC4_WENVI|nr:hypothetical protein AQ490_25280 [Wenjunlia vitaminophila]
MGFAARRTRRRPTLVAAVLSLLTGTLVATATPARAVAGYDRQPIATNALFLINASDHAGAQEFVTSEGRVETVSAYLTSNASTGTFHAQIRTEVADESTTVADSRLDIAELGGSGTGWVEFPVDAELTADTKYYLVVEAEDAAGKVVWNGWKGALAGALPSWNYDVPYWGGWKAYDTDPWATTHLAFAIDPSGAQACAATNTCYKSVPPGELVAYTAGLLGNGRTTAAITPLEAHGATYVPDSNVLRLPNGDWRYLPAGATEPRTVPAGDPGAAAQIAESQDWLASGSVPGETLEERAAAKRALLSLRLLTQPNGAMAAAWHGAWSYSWPRDSSVAAVAFARTGHDEEAYRILDYNRRTQRPDGTWEARTKLDGSGPPDGRHWQLDANGWVPWSIWEWYQAAPGAHRAELTRDLYPTVRKAADYAAASLDERGLPPAAPDYWEIPTSTPNISTSAILLSGLNASADLARVTGHPQDAERWRAAAARLADGIEEHFAPLGYQRTVDGKHGRDSAVTFLAPPYNTAPDDLAVAMDDTYAALLRPNGGVVPGDDPGQKWRNTWTPETAFFALAWAGTGEDDKADRVVDWLLAHRNVLGELPEQIDAAGNPASVVPLGWTDSLLVLTLDQLDGGPIPVPPAPCDPPGRPEGACHD